MRNLIKILHKKKIKKLLLIASILGILIFPFKTGLKSYNSLDKNENNNIIKPNNQVTVSQLWNFSTADSIYSSPALRDIDDDGKLEVIFGSYDSNVYSLEGENGDLKWTYGTGGEVKSSPSIGDLNGDGTLEVAIGSNDFKLHIINAEDGNYVWSYYTAYHLTAIPSLADIDDDNNLEVFVAGTDTSVYAFDIETTTKIWEYNVPLIVNDGCFYSSPALGDLDGDYQFEAVVGNKNGTVYAFDAENGNIIWKYQAGDPITCPSTKCSGQVTRSPVLADFDDDYKDEVVFCCKTSNKTYALNGEDGSVLWNFTANNWLLSPLAVGDLDRNGDLEIIYGDMGGDIYALNGEDGSIFWQFSTNGSIHSGPAIGDLDGDNLMEVIIGDYENGDIFTLNAEDGTISWNYSLGNPIRSAPALGDLDGDGDLEVVIGCLDGYIYALNPTPAGNEFGWQGYSGDPEFHRKNNYEYVNYSYENKPPYCEIKFQRQGSEISEIKIYESFDIYIGDSIDDYGIKQVRFSSDDNQDDLQSGIWTDWFDWNNSSQDWNATTKIKKWAFTTVDDKEVWVELKDTNNTLGSAHKDIDCVNQWWEFNTIEKDLTQGINPSLNIDSLGNPAISYYNHSTQELIYAYREGINWIYNVVDTGEYIGRYNDLQFNPENYPAIAYYDYENYYLKYASWNGTGWDHETIEYVEPYSSQYSVSYCKGPSLSFDSTGNPGIAYYDGGSYYDLKYAYYDGVNWQIDTVYHDGWDGGWARRVSLAFNEIDTPFISFRYMPSGQSYSAWGLGLATLSGASWNIERIDSGYGTGSFNSMNFGVHGNPSIVYVWQGVYQGTKEIRFASFNGSEWAIEVVDSDGAHMSTACYSNSNNLGFSYYSSATLDLVFAYYNGTDWINEVVKEDAIESFNNLPNPSFVYLPDETPAIAYFDILNNDIIFAEKIKIEPNTPPNDPTIFGQYKSDGSTQIPESGTTNESDVVFKGIISDPDGDNVRLEIELREFGDDFNGIPTSETISKYVSSGTEVNITRYGLSDGDYKWQYRVRDKFGAVSNWTEFGENGNIDFSVDLPIDQPPICSVELQSEGTEISEVAVGEFFDIFVGDSTDDNEIKKVRFSSDDSQDANPTGEWIEYNWTDSIGDWNASTKIKEWSFATSGEKELWVEVEDNLGQTSACSVKIEATFPSIVISDSLIILPNAPHYVSEDLMALFTIKNTGKNEVDLSALTVGGRDPDGFTIDFTWKNDIHILPNEEYTYYGNLILPEKPGNYHFFCSYRNIYGAWNPSIDLDTGLNDEDRNKDIFVADAKIEYPLGGIIVPENSFPEANGQPIPLYIPKLIENSNKIRENDGWETVKELVDFKIDSFNWRDFFANFKCKRANTPQSSALSMAAGMVQSISNTISGMKLKITIQEKNERFRAIIQLGDPADNTFIREKADMGGWTILNDNFIVRESLSEYLREAFHLPPVNSPSNYYTLSVDIDENHKTDLYVAYLSLNDDGKLVYTPKIYPDDKIEIVRVQEFLSFPYRSDTIKEFYCEKYITLLDSYIGEEQTKELLELLFPNYLVSNKVILVQGNSPIELRVYESNGNMTGIINGVVNEGIINAVYNEFNQEIIIYNPNGSYTYEIEGEDDGNYGLDITYIDNNSILTFSSIDIPILNKSIHTYHINWTNLAQGKDGVLVKVDSDGDGIFDYSFYSDGELTKEEFDQNTRTPPGISGYEIFFMAIALIGAGLLTIRKFKHNFELN